MKNLQITITLEDDNKTIALVEVYGAVHNMFEEMPEEKERYQKMTVSEFIEDYVKYEQSSIDCDFIEGSDIVPNNQEKGDK